MSQPQPKRDEEEIAAAVSKFAEQLPSPPPEEGKYQLEATYADLARLARRDAGKGFFRYLLDRLINRPETDDFASKSVLDPQDVLAAIQREDAAQALKEKQDTHIFRKVFLFALFILICVWLGFVISFVNANATSPSMEEREKLLQVENQLISLPAASSNRVDISVIRTVSPKFRDGYFHLSDSVLIAFITSTTVAVLGLFLTAAHWLFDSNPKRESNPIEPKK